MQWAGSDSPNLDNVSQHLSGGLYLMTPGLRKLRRHSDEECREKNYMSVTLVDIIFGR